MRLTLIWTTRRIFWSWRQRCWKSNPARCCRVRRASRRARRIRRKRAAANLFTKLPEEYPLPPQETELVGLTLQGLTEAFLRIWARKPASDESPETNHYAPRDIHRDEHNVQECMLTLLKGVSSRGCLRFEETFSAAPSKEEVVTLFLALLELLKLGEIHAEQEGTWGEIVLYPGRGKDVDEYGESATEETE